MKKLFSSALFLFAMILMVGAQDPLLSVTGHVTDDVTGSPIQNHLVVVTVIGGGMYQDYEFFTNEAGYYGSEAIPAFELGIVRAATFDCMGEEHAGEEYYGPNNNIFIFDFEICSDSIPQGDCENWFWYETWNNMDFTFMGDAFPEADGYYWDFGDGNTGSGQIAEHSYEQGINDILNVTLTTFVYDPATGDSCFDTSTQEVWVGNGGGGDCQADFEYTIDSTPAGVYIAQFTDLSIGNPSFWNWDFGDGDFSEEQNPEHIYYEQGTYFVCLTIYSDSMNNCYDTYCEEIVVGSGGGGDCENWFWYETYDNITFDFHGDAFPDAGDNYFWDFGDGDTGFGQDVSHTYDTNTGDLFVVTLTTIHTIPGAADTCIATSAQEVWVGNGGGDCQADFEYSIDSTPAGVYVAQFTDLSIGNPSFWNWDFGDGDFSEEQNPEHIYYEQGTYLVCLTIYSDSMNNCYDTYCEEIVVGSGGGGDCENWFWYETYDNITFNFFGESFPSAADNYFWDFGDGYTGFGQEVSHTYDSNSGDIFLVTLTTFTFDPATGDSCVAFSEQEIWVGGQGNDCENWFWYDTEDFLTFEFFGESYPYAADEYIWDFGDGETGNGQEVEHTYDPNIGEVVLVTLTTFAYDPATGDSCIAFSEQEVWLENTWNDCENWFWYESYGDFNFDFYGESFPMPAEEYIWEFGDGTTATGQQVSHTFDPALGDEFLVCLHTYSFVQGNDSCYAVSCQEIWLGGQSGHELFGTVNVENTPVDYALVGLFGMDNTGSYIYEFTMTDEGTGAYFFEDVPDGDYYIWASLLPMSQYYWEYFPTYFGDALFWFDAELITLGEPNNPYDVNLIPVGSFNSGPGNITGTINFDNGKGAGDNVSVVLMDEEENALSYILSNEEGLFEFGDMAYGTYKLKVEMPGVNSETATVVLDENNQTVEVAFVVKGATAYLSIDNSLQLISGIGEIFPNPVSDYANIEIALNENSNVTVSIINQLGQVVYTSNQTLASGKQQIKLDTSDLPEGFYNVQLSGENGGMLVKKFVKVK